MAGHRFVVALRTPRALVLRLGLGERGLVGLAEALAAAPGVRVSGVGPRPDGLRIEVAGYRGRVLGSGSDAAWLLVSRAANGAAPNGPHVSDAASAFTAAIAGLMGCAPETARTLGRLAWHVADLLCASSVPLADRPDPG
jgi:hypothetical protein